MKSAPPVGLKGESQISVNKLNAFLGLLTEGQRAGIEVVTADGARRIADAVAERLPGAELAVDPFHAASRATGALDELRRRSWREAGSRPAPKRRRGHPRKGKPAPPDPAGPVKGLGFPPLKNPEDLTEGQASALAGLKRTGAALWRGYLLEEGLRAVFRAGPERAAGELDRWLAWACRCRIPEFVELSRKVRRKRDGTLRSIALGVSNARVEAVNNKIKVADQTGLRLQEHGQPDRPHHAQVLGPEAGATGEDGFVTPIHTNSRSLFF